MKRQIYLFRDVLPDEEEEDFIVKLAGIMTAKVVKGSISLPEKEKPEKKKKRKVRTRKTFPKKDKEEDLTKVVGKNETGGIRVLPELPTDTKMSKDTVLDDDGNKIKYEYPMLEIF